MLKIKRVYEDPSPEDGFRVLVDRLWPRGLKKEKAKVDLWLKDIAPSDALRKRFAHDPARWPEFERGYGAELTKKKALVAELKHLEREKKRLTLLFGAKDERFNNAAALLKRLKKS